MCCGGGHIGFQINITKNTPEAVNQRRTDNIKAKKDKKTNMIVDKTLHRKLKIEQHEPH